MNRRKCPDRDTLAEFAEGRLANEQVATIGLHLDTCETCQDCLMELPQSSDSLVAALKVAAPHNEFINESGMRRADELIRAIGQDFAPEHPGSDSAAAAMPEVLGQYQLLEKLGEGGMGTVYRALHTRLKMIVALKVLRSDRLSDPSAVGRLNREIEAVGKLLHPNIVRATDAGDDAGRHFLVMELIQGIDLGHLASSSIPIAVADACEIVRQAANGLQHAHENGLVHRDIKPSNLMLSDRGEVKILDLGLALLANESRNDETDLTQAGQIMGTLNYMAPEQAASSHTVDIRADVYSLGATLFKLLSGHSPYPQSRFETPIKQLAAIVTEQAPSISTVCGDLPAGLVTGVDRMLDKDPNNRFATPGAVAEALTEFAAGADLNKLAERSVDKSAHEFDNSAISTHAHVTDERCDTDEFVEAQQLAAPATATAPQRNPVARYPRVALGTTLVLLLLLGVITIFMFGKETSIQVTIADGIEGIEVSVVGAALTIDDKKSGQKLEIQPGEHTLHVKQGALEFDVRDFRITRGEQVAVEVKFVEGVLAVLRDGQRISEERTPNFRATLRSVEDALAVLRDGQRISEERLPKLRATLEEALLAQDLRVRYDAAELLRKVDPQTPVVVSYATPYVPQGNLIPIDIRALANHALDEDLGIHKGGNLESLPTGEQTLADVRFSIGKKYIRFDRETSKVDKIQFSRRLAKLHILQSAHCAGGMPHGLVIGGYRVNYSDGSREIITIILGHDVYDWWWRDDWDSGSAESKTAWLGTNAASRRHGLHIRLFRTTWENPHPEKTVSSLDIVPAERGPTAPFCVAITAEEAPIGEYGEY